MRRRNVKSSASKQPAEASTPPQPLSPPAAESSPLWRYVDSVSRSFRSRWISQTTTPAATPIREAPAAPSNRTLFSPAARALHDFAVGDAATDERMPWEDLDLDEFGDVRRKEADAKTPRRRAAAAAALDAASVERYGAPPLPAVPPREDILALKARRAADDALVPPAIDGAAADALFRRWLASRWFAPGAFLESLVVKRRDCLLAPFFVFSCGVTSVHRGALAVPLSAHEASADDARVRWLEHEEAMVFSHLKSIYAPASPSFDPKSLALRAAASLATAGARAHDTQPLAQWGGGAAAAAATSFDADSDSGRRDEREWVGGSGGVVWRGMPSASWRRAWHDYVHMQLLRAEREPRGDRLRAKRRGVSTRDVTTSTSFGEVRWQLVFVPVIVYRYAYDNEREYTFAVNAADGTSFGTRPYGFGGVLDTLLSLVTLAAFLSSGDEREREARVVDGAALADEDARLYPHRVAHRVGRYYIAGARYLTLPPSDQFLGFQFTGAALIVNLSATRDVTVRAVPRRGAPVSVAARLATHTLRVAAGDQCRVAFRGHWALRVVDGDADAVQISARVRGGRSSEDLMNMI